MFPLGTVLLPSVVLPLHVFEPRYRALVGDCLSGDREFGVVLIERGSEVGGGDVRTRVGTIARIVDVAELGDGRLNLLAVGTERIRVLAWLPDDPYPIADIEPWPDPDRDDESLHASINAIVGRLARVFALATELGAPPSPSIDPSQEPGLASFQVTALAPLGPLDRHRLLSAPSTRSRIGLLEAMLLDVELLLNLQLGNGTGTAEGE